MKKWLCLLCILSALDSSADSKSNTFTFGKEKKQFIIEHNFLISTNCNDDSCEALLAIKSFKEKKANLKKSDFTGGKNPKSVYCTKLMDGRSVFGSSADGDQQLFCLFKDGSMLGFI